MVSILTSMNPKSADVLQTTNTIIEILRNFKGSIEEEKFIKTILNLTSTFKENLENEVNDTLIQDIDAYIDQLNMYLDNNEMSEEPSETFNSAISAIKSELLHLRDKVDTLHKSLDPLLSRLPLHIVHGIFKTPPQSIKKQDITWSDLATTGFRGDDRNPGELFQRGLDPREESKDTTSFITKPFVSNNNYVVAFTKHMDPAKLFPQNVTDDESTTYIYIFESKKVSNVHSHGYLSYGEKGMNNELEAQLLFAQELITEKVPPEDIIGAVKVIRSRIQDKDALPEYLKNPPSFMSANKDNLSKEDADMIEGHRNYMKLLEANSKITMIEYIPNDDCTLSSEKKQLIKELMLNEIAINQFNDQDRKSEILFDYYQNNKSSLKKKGLSEKDFVKFLNGKLQDEDKIEKIQKIWGKLFNEMDNRASNICSQYLRDHLHEINEPLEDKDKISKEELRIYIDSNEDEIDKLSQIKQAILNKKVADFYQASMQPPMPNSGYQQNKRK